MNIKRMFWMSGPLGILLVSAVLAGRCPNGGEWLPNYICVARDSAGSCTQWQYVGHSCQ